ncbi:MAG: C40 family peptidase [Bacteroidota bacterium]
MEGIKHFILVCVFLVTGFASQAQVKVFDKLEMLYDQQHYTLVLKKAERLLDNPEYDYSQIPSLYKSMALFQLSQNEYWYKRHTNALDEATELFLKIKSSSDGKKVFEAHIFEVSALKRDLISWSEDLKRTGNRQAFEYVQELMNGLFENVPDILEKEVRPEEIIVEATDLTESITRRKNREEIIEMAKKYVGVPYVWAGNDPKGFDCSGFTSYVMRASLQQELPRRAKDQFEGAVKVKQKDVQMGDLVFFDNGSGVSHVGIIASNKGEPLKMIHASSSKGIVITDIEQSTYWQKRIFAFGTYVTD